MIPAAAPVRAWRPLRPLRNPGNRHPPGSSRLPNPLPVNRLRRLRGLHPCLHRRNPLPRDRRRNRRPRLLRSRSRSLNLSLNNNLSLDWLRLMKVSIRSGASFDVP